MFDAQSVTLGSFAHSSTFAKCQRCATKRTEKVTALFGISRVNYVVVCVLRDSIKKCLHPDPLNIRPCGVAPNTLPTGRVSAFELPAAYQHAATIDKRSPNFRSDEISLRILPGLYLCQRFRQGIFGFGGIVIKLKTDPKVFRHPQKS